MRSLFPIIAALLSLASVTHAQLVGPMERFNGMLGTWQVEGTWSWGATLEATAVHTAGLNGHFMEIKTTVSDNGGPEYVRYTSTVYHDAAESTYRTFSRQHTGGAADAPWTPDVRDGRDVWTSGFDTDGASIREELSLTEDDTMLWVVEMKRGDGPWLEALHAEWKRVEPMKNDAVTKPIDPSLFDASGPDVRSFTKTREIEAPAQRVYDAWATGDGFLKAMGREGTPTAALVDQAIGGRFEWLWDGEIGSNGCQTLCYIPGRLICFTWNAPPGQATRERRTWVAVQIEELGDGRTNVTLSHAGFGEGDDWDETYDYFDQAWDQVLDAMKTNLEGE